MWTTQRDAAVVELEDQHAHELHCARVPLVPARPLAPDRPQQQRQQKGLALDQHVKMFLRRQRFVVENDGGVRSETARSSSARPAGQAAPTRSIASPPPPPDPAPSGGGAVRWGSIGDAARRARTQAARARVVRTDGRVPRRQLRACVRARPGPVRDEGFRPPHS